MQEYPEGFGVTLNLKTSPEHPRSDAFERGSLVYLRRIGSDSRFEAFPILNSNGNRLEILLGSKEAQKKWAPKSGDKIFLADFQKTLHRNLASIADGWGQTIASFETKGLRTQRAGFRRHEKNKLPKELVSLCQKNLAKPAVPLEPVSLPEDCAKTKTSFEPTAPKSLLMLNTPAFRENFWRGWELTLKNGEKFLVTASLGSELTLDRPHKLTEKAEGILSPDGVKEYFVSRRLKEDEFLFKFPEAALLPGELILNGHAPYPNEAPLFDIALYNFSEGRYEDIIKNQTFAPNDTISLGRITKAQRSKEGTLKLKISAQGGDLYGYQLSAPAIIPATRLREKNSERAASFLVRCEAKAGGKTRRSFWLIQRQEGRACFAAKRLAVR